MSFFDDDDEEPPTTIAPPGGGTTTRPRPRRPQRAGGSGGPGGPSSIDHHAIMVRRRLVAAVGVVLLIAIVLIVNGCLKSRKQQSLESYNQNVGQIAQDSVQQVAQPLFASLLNASSKQALDVEVQVDQLRMQAQQLAERAKALSVPGEMTAPQRDLLLALNLREEGVAKIAALVRSALGGQSKQATTTIAGDMEIFLASDVIYSQRVVPLIQETLSSNGISGQSTPSSSFMPNLGWLTPETVLARITGQSPTSGPVAPGTHGDTLVGVSVGTNKLAPSPELNHITGGANPTFTVTFENSGSDPETNVKVDVSVTTEGRTVKASHVVDRTEPGSTTNVDIPVTGVTVGGASRITVNVEPVPGETETENNKATYLAIFEH